MNTLINILVIIGCIVFQAFFSGSEMAILAADKLRLRRKAKEGSAGAALFLKFLKNPRWFLAATTTGTNMAVIIASVTAALWFETRFGNYGEAMTILCLSPVLLMLGEIIPRTIFQNHATEIAPRLAYPLLFASRAISPVTFLIVSVSRLFSRRSSMDAMEHFPLASRDELAMMLDRSDRGSDLLQKEKILIRQVFHLAKASVEDVMIPLVNVTALSDETIVSEAVKSVARTGFSRLPVYSERIDNIIGIIHAFDLIKAPDPRAPVRTLVRDVPFVPEINSAQDLLIFLQKTRNSFAVVVDEYGGAVGIITLEDLLEEVVGEIRDEYDFEDMPIARLDNNRFRVSAQLDLQEVNERLKIQLPEGDYETIAGFVLKHMKKVPKIGESMNYGEIQLTVSQAGRRGIREIIIQLPRADAAQSRTDS